MNRKHPVKIKSNQHQGGLVGSILRAVSLALKLLTTPLRELCGQLPQHCSSVLGHLAPRQVPVPENSKWKNSREVRLGEDKLTFGGKSKHVRSLCFRI